MIFVVKKIPYHLGTCFFWDPPFYASKKITKISRQTSPTTRATARPWKVPLLNWIVPWDEFEVIWMFPKIVGFTPKSSILIRVFHEINHPYWGIPIFGNTHMQGFGPTRLAIVTPGPWVKTATELPLKFRFDLSVTQHDNSSGISFVHGRTHPWNVSDS